MREAEPQTIDTAIASFLTSMAYLGVEVTEEELRQKIGSNPAEMETGEGISRHALEGKLGPQPLAGNLPGLLRDKIGRKVAFSENPESASGNDRQDRRKCHRDFFGFIHGASLFLEDTSLR